MFKLRSSTRGPELEGDTSPATEGRIIYLGDQILMQKDLKKILLRAKFV